MIDIRIFGIRIKLSFWFVAFLTLLLIIDQTGILFYGIISAILHEMGHVIVLIAFRRKPKLLSFELSGIRLVENRYPLGYFRELIALSSGCICNICLFITFYFLGFITFATTNLCLALFNLLPSKVLDGGRILYLIIFHHTTAQKADRIFFILSAIVAIALSIAGGYLFFYTLNPTLFITGLYLLLNLFRKK